MKTLALTSALALFIGSAATAGSMAAPAVEPTIVPTVAAPAVTDWSGFYLGGSAGSMTGNEDWYGSDYAFSGTRYGGFAGYNHQTASGLVYGGEVAVSMGEQQFEWNASEVYDMTIMDAKARVGMAAGNALIFASAGFSTASYESNGWGDYEATGYNYGVGIDYLVTDSVFIGAEAVFHELEEAVDTPNWTETVTTLNARIGVKF